MTSSPDPAGAVRRRFALFAYGFRPFFWAAGAFALLAILVWLAVFATGAQPLPNQPPSLWHGHEMIYGFLCAAIAGFLLTAVPSWTGTRGFAGTPLIVLAGLWLAGRAAFWSASVIAFPVVAVCDLLFLPALGALLARPLLRARNRNTPLLLVLAGIWATDALFMRALATSDPVLTHTTLLVAIDIIIVLVTVIGGRIIPAFTASALRVRCRPADLRIRPWLDRMVIAAMVAVMVSDFRPSWQGAAGVLAGVAAVLHAWRLSGWRGLDAIDEPLVWSLHLAYAWLPLGLALKCVFLLTAEPWSQNWLHALTIGVTASMILAVMTRAALGHTGRALQVAKPIAVAYVLLSLAAAARVFIPPLAPSESLAIVIGAGILWAGAFALFLAVYTPILWRPRIDSKPG